MFKKRHPATSHPERSGAPRSEGSLTNSFVIGIFNDEKNLLASAREIREGGIDIYDVYAPYPIHALEGIMGIRRSRLPYVCFGAGLGGCFLALVFQVWTSATNWPLNVGGKPLNSFPAFIPIAFEITVLLGGLVTTAAFLARSELFPLKHILPLRSLLIKPRLFHEKVTDDHFMIAVERTPALDVKKVRHILERHHAIAVEERGTGP